MLTTTTNHQPRPILHWHDLTDDERQEHDYLDTPDTLAGIQAAMQETLQ